MKVLIKLGLCSTLLVFGAVAQRHGGGARSMGGGGFSRGSVGGGFSRGSSFSSGRSSFGGGSTASSFRGSVGSSGYRGGVVSNGFRGGVGVNRGVGYNRGFNSGIGFNRGFRGYYGYGYGWPYGGYGYGYGLGYGVGYGYGYGYSPYYDYYNYPSSYYPDSYGYQTYDPSPNVTVVYPPAQQASAVYAQRATPMVREYDQYGQQLQQQYGQQPQPQANGDPSSSPIYLIAMKNHNIYAAASYSVNGDALHYVTLDHAEKQVSLDSIDRELTTRLNRERHVMFQLPSQQ